MSRASATRKRAAPGATKRPRKIKAEPADSGRILATSSGLNAFASYIGPLGHPDLASALVRQAADLELLSPELQLCWGGPFNGQAGRSAIVAEMLAVIKPAAVVETGTYRGISTAWFAEHLKRPIFSCEFEELYLLQARHRLQDAPNVKLERADSRDFLRGLLPTLKNDAAYFFYLDAHWQDDLPLKEELSIIFSASIKAVVMIDDFKVPDDLGYGWDDYGPGKCLDASQFEGAAPEDAAFFVPVLSSEHESGAKRGCCVVTRYPDIVARCTLLRRLSLADMLVDIAPPSEQTPTGASMAGSSRSDATADPSGVATLSLAWTEGGHAERLRVLEDSVGDHERRLELLEIETGTRNTRRETLATVTAAAHRLLEGLKSLE